MKVTFLGCGNMAKAMIEGIVSKGVVDACDVTATTAHAETAQAAAAQLGIAVDTDNRAAVKGADVVVLAVKPYLYQDTIAQTREDVPDGAVVATVAPGKTIAWVQEQFGRQVKVVRTAPNTPAKVLAGLTGYCSSDSCTPEDVDAVKSLIDSFGVSIEVPEKLMDVIATVGGSSPAFVYMFIEALADGGVSEGLPRDMALTVSAQAVLGAAKMVLESDDHPGTLKDRVCSPAGSTIKGVEQLELGAFRGTVTNAIRMTTQAARNL